MIEKNYLWSWRLRVTVTFPGIGTFTRQCVSEARASTHLRTLFKRRRSFAHIRHASASVRAQAERQAVNFRIQGSAADVCKLAMLRVDAALTADERLTHVRLLYQIHDELLYEVPDDQLQRTAGAWWCVSEQ